MDDQDDVEEGDVSQFERFKQAWRNERTAPALLPFDEDLVEDIKQMLKDQVSKIHSRCSGARTVRNVLLLRQRGRRERTHKRSCLYA